MNQIELCIRCGKPTIVNVKPCAYAASLISDILKRVEKTTSFFEYALKIGFREGEWFDAYIYHPNTSITIRRYYVEDFGQLCRLCYQELYCVTYSLQSMYENDLVKQPNSIDYSPKAIDLLR